MTSIALDRVSWPALARWRPLLAWWAVSRLVTLLAFLVLRAIGPQDHFGAQFYRGPLGLFGTWDGVWYQRVAQHGYLLIPGQQSDPAFFPFFPLLLRALHELALPYTAAGVLVSNAALVVAVVSFYEVGRRVVGEGLALRAAVFMAVSPMAFVFSMSYPVSLVLALASLAFLAALEDRWLIAACLAAAAGLTRPETLALVVPLAALAWSRRAALTPAARGRALTAVLAAPAALATYPLYLKWALNDAQAWRKAERFWGRGFHVTGPLRAVTTLPQLLHAHPALVRDAILLCVYVCLLVAAARAGVGRPWIAAGALVIILPLFSSTVESEGRFGLLAFPLYWGAASLAKSRRVECALRVGSLGLMTAGVLTLPYIWP